MKKEARGEKGRILKVLACLQQNKRRRDEVVEKVNERKEISQGEEKEQPDSDPTQEDQFGIDFGAGEQEENKGSNEELQLDFPFSNINRIWSYLRKEGEQRLLELKNQITASPCVFGAHLEKVPVLDNKVEMGVFLKKLVQLRDRILSEDKLLATINRESGAKIF